MTTIPASLAWVSAVLPCSDATLDPGPAEAAPDPGLRGIVDAVVPASWFAREQPAILVALIDVAQWRPWRDHAAVLLDCAETARVARRRFDADREMLTIAYAMHRLLLGRMLGRDPRQVPLHRDGRGCPRVTGDPVHTSLSHADGVIAIAMTHAGAVGVDVERAARVAEMPSLAGRICHPDDLAALAGLDADGFHQALLRLWVRKEAALKAAGVGLAVGMETFAVPDDGCVELPLPAVGGVVQVRMLDAGAGCVAAVAGVPDAAISCRWLRPTASPAAR